MDPRVSPQAEDDYAIRVSAQNGHTDVVRMLLMDPRVSPQAGNNDAIRIASHRDCEIIIDGSKS